MDMSLKTFLAILAVSMLTIGTLTPALAVSPKAYSFEDNLELAMPDVAYEQPYVPGEILVKFKPGVSEAKIKAMNSKNGASVTYTSPYAGFKKMNIPKTKSVEEMVEIYSKNPNVEYAVPNVRTYALTDDQYYSSQWNFHGDYGINVEPVWTSSTGNGVVVAVLDTGVAYEEYYDPKLKEQYYKAPDLADTNIIAGYDFVNNDTHPNDDDSHGTHVTGTIAQSTNNGIGVAGVAYNCTIMPVKVLGPDGGSLQQLVEGIYFANESGAQIISMSLGFPPNTNVRFLAPLFPALDTAYNNGIVIVAAAGNDGKSKIGYPAAYEKCIAVGATNSAGNKAYYSNYGDALDVMAPGGELYRDSVTDAIYGDGIIQNTFNNNYADFDYYAYQGTSMATPHVAGVAALLISEYPDSSNAEIREAIEYTASNGPSGWNSEYGYGLINAKAALDYLDSPSTPTNNPPVTNAGGPYSGAVGNAVTFDGRLSTDDGTIDSYQWDFDYDGTSFNVDATGDTCEHTYTVADTYTVALKVTDNDGLTDIDTTTAIITTAPLTPSIDVSIGDMNVTPTGRNTFVFATAQINVKIDGEAVDGTVNGDWTVSTTAYSDSGTISSGTAIVESNPIKYKGESLTFTFTVASVNTSDGTTYYAPYDFNTVPQNVEYIG